MPLITVLTHDPHVRNVLGTPVRSGQSIAWAGSWDRLGRLIVDRPTTATIIDSAALPCDLPEDAAVTELRVRFPSMATVLIARAGVDPASLFRLGKSGLESLVLMPTDGLQSGVQRAMRDALTRTTASLVTRAVSPFLPYRETAVVRMALEGAQLGWSAEALADRVGLSRPHLSVRLKACGLPSTGHMLVWAKLLHAGRWLADPGRSAESVARQLDYSSGAAFRRALRSYVDATPTEVARGGGLALVLDRFLDECGLRDRLHVDLSVA